MFDFESHVVASVFTIQQTSIFVCHRSNYYFVMFSTNKFVIFFATGLRQRLLSSPCGWQVSREGASCVPKPCFMAVKHNYRTIRLWPCGHACTKRSLFLQDAEKQPVDNSCPQTRATVRNKTEWSLVIPVIFREIA
jgi:hypothetical protein